ncbi:hypothetical protein [Micromonospora sp. WMMD737]|uniref:hypothetical protein n=1 Tax=Micromonospora sp. WMMD737 TaxID=3404113 RepID=UPI003B95FD49
MRAYRITASVLVRLAEAGAAGRRPGQGGGSAAAGSGAAPAGVAHLAGLVGLTR